MPAPATSRDLRFLDPAILARLGTMELKARTVVEGFLAGLHRSPYKGFSVEFAEYRQYLPGDDLSTLDWKIYARSDRHYVKKFEEETNLECHVLLDVSASMAYRGAAPMFQDMMAGQLDFAVVTLTEVLPLDGLDAKGVAAVMADVTGTTPARDDARQMWTRTGGNPLFVRELTRMLTNHGAPAGHVQPPAQHGVYEILQRQTSHLTHACRQMLMVAAVAGRELRPDLLRRVLPAWRRRRAPRRSRRPRYGAARSGGPPPSPGRERTCHLRSCWKHTR